MHSLKAVSPKEMYYLPFVAYAVHKKRTYKNMKEILSCMNYKKHQWPISSDFKVTAIWMALQTVKQNSVISYMNGIVVPKVFRAGKELAST
jgi:hypothetical protein